MKLNELLEGVVKRDGELSTYRQNPTLVIPPKPVQTKAFARIQKMADRTGKTAQEIIALYQEVEQTLDMKRPGAYAAREAKVQRALGLRESKVN